MGERRVEGKGSWVAAGSITETVGRAAERATKGDENFPQAAELLSRTIRLKIFGKIDRCVKRTTFVKRRLLSAIHEEPEESFFFSTRGSERRNRANKWQIGQ